MMKLKYIILHTFIFILFFVNLITPFSYDILLSWATAFQADYLGDFPDNVYHSWGLRGIGYKFLMYILYRFVDIFIDTTNTFQFQIVSKFIYYFFFLGLSFIGFRGLRKNLADIGIPWYDGFIIFVICILSSPHGNIMQAEEVPIFLTIGMISLSLSDNRYLNYLNGIFIPLMLSLKGITVLFAVYPFVILLYFNLFHDIFKDQLKRFIVGCTAFGIFTVMFYIFIIPLEINDLYNASQLQTSFVSQFGVNFFTIKYLYYFSYFLFKSVLHQPPLIFGGFLYLLVFISFIKNRKLYPLVFLISCSVIPLIGVLLQNYRFGYHYLGLVPLAIIMVIYVYAKNQNYLIFSVGNQEAKKKYAFQPRLEGNTSFHFRINILYAFCTSTMLVWFFLVLSPIGPFQNGVENYTLYNKAYRADKIIFKEIDSKFQLSNEENILFLSPGDVNFFIRSKSYLRYLYPLPLRNRIMYPKLMETQMYLETMKQVLDYKGKYIFLTADWFDLDFFPQISLKLNEEFEEVFHDISNKGSNSELIVYRRKKT